MPPPDRSSPPPRWLRTLPWLAGLLLGTAAHLVWWTRVPHEAAETRVVEARVPTPPTVEIHIHPATPGGPVVSHARERGCHRRAHARGSAPYPVDPRPTARASEARGAVVCSSEGCTIRRRFLRQLIEDPRIVGQGTRLVPVRDEGELVGLRVLGVFPGSLPDLLGMQTGDTITALDGQPIDGRDGLMSRLLALPRSDGFSITLRRHDLLRTMRYSIVDG